MAEGDPQGSAFHRLRVCEVVAETPDARSIMFTVPSESAQHFDYRPGQFLTLRIPSDRTGSVARCYSLSSSPHTDDRLQVTVKRTADGYGSNWVCDNIRAGMNVEVLPPAGLFTPKSLNADLLLFAGGSGITPVMSIVKSALAEGDGKITLVYANRDERSVIFAEALQRLTEKTPERLTVIHWLETVQGLPTVPMLRAIAVPFAERDAFICGPAAFRDAVKLALRELGFRRDRLHIEKFVSLARNPFETGNVPTAAAGTDELDAAVEVTLDGRTASYRWPRQQKLLDLLLEQGLDAPFSCREGQCSACACRVEVGEVRMLHNEVLEEEDLTDNIRLACQSVPVTDRIKISYD
ncbi:MAG: 2Fe-2S iron-sulfur cluster-binding protein [Sciscionella sp.]